MYVSWFSLPQMRDRYCALLDRIEMYKAIGINTKNLEAECWEIRKEAFSILVKLRTDGQDVTIAANSFGWSVNQLDSDALRSWLCKSEETPVVSTQHHPLGQEGLWHTPSKKVPEKQQLPAYIQNTARALMRDQGMDESQAIATAINAVKSWAAGTAFGGHVKVTDEVKEAARRAMKEWEDLKASHHE
jgi:hypothetical protein